MDPITITIIIWIAFNICALQIIQKDLVADDINPYNFSKRK